MIKLAPSILSADFAKLGEQVEVVRAAGAQYLHVDVMDGHFVPNISIGVPVVKSLRKCCNMVLDVHMMIDNPEKYIKPFSDAGADIINFHFEAAKDPEKLIDEIVSLGKLPAMTVKPATSIESLFPYVSKLSMALIMSVEPGFGGQEFMPSALEKAKKLRAFAPELDIEIDGGIHLGNLRPVIESGVNVIVAGSAIFGEKDPAEAVRSFLRLGNRLLSN